MHAPASDSPLEHLAAFLARYRSQLWTVLLYAAAIGVVGLALPIAVQALVSSVAFGTVLQPIVVLSILLLGGLSLAGAFRALKSWTVEVLQRRMFIDTAARLAYVLPRVDWAAGSGASVGQPSHYFFELFALHKATTSLLLGAVEAVLATFVGLLVLAFYHPVLLAFDLVVVVAIAIIVLGLGRGGVRTALEESSAKYRLAGSFSRIERMAGTLRGSSAERQAHGEIDRLCAAYLEARASHYRVALRQLVGALATQALASAALLGLGGYLVIQRELTLGQLVAAELIVAAVIAALGDLGKHLETYYDLVASVYKLDRVLDLPVEPDESEGKGPGAITAALSLSNPTLGSSTQEQT